MTLSRTTVSSQRSPRNKDHKALCDLRILVVFVKEPSAVSLSTQGLSYGVEHAVDERHGLFPAERAGQFERLVDDHLCRRRGLGQQLVNREAEDQAVDDGGPLDPPVLQVA